MGTAQMPSFCMAVAPKPPLVRRSFATKTVPQFVFLPHVHQKSGDVMALVLRVPFHQVNMGVGSHLDSLLGAGSVGLETQLFHDGCLAFDDGALSSTGQKRSRVPLHPRVLGDLERAKRQDFPRQIIATTHHHFMDP
jgi:hypothetical protein